MMSDPEGTVLALFAAFCRIGGCIMVLPGFSSFRVPVQIRLFIAVAIAMALLPVLWDTIYPSVQAGGRVYIALVGVELLIGVTFGLIARYIVLALQFAGTGLSMAIGFNAAPGGGLLETEQEGHITALDHLHRGAAAVPVRLSSYGDFEPLVRSYDFMPLGSGFDPQMALDDAHGYAFRARSCLCSGYPARSWSMAWRSTSR
jgi:flagellar biosynthetic protein FliR